MPPTVAPVERHQSACVQNEDREAFSPPSLFDFLFFPSSSSSASHFVQPVYHAESHRKAESLLTWRRRAKTRFQLEQSLKGKVT
jgi:hypothetical protein